MNQLAGMLHSLCCSKRHSEDMKDILRSDDTKCHFYLEQTIEDPWEQRDHVFWEKESRIFIEDLKANNPQEALDILRKVMNVVRAAEILLDEYPAARQMLIRLLN